MRGSNCCHMIQSTTILDGNVIRDLMLADKASQVHLDDVFAVKWSVDHDGGCQCCLSAAS